MRAAVLRSHDQLNLTSFYPSYTEKNLISTPKLLVNVQWNSIYTFELNLSIFL